MEKREFNIIAETGIHARPATLLVQAASKFNSDIKVPMLPFLLKVQTRLMLSLLLQTQ